MSDSADLLDNSILGSLTDMHCHLGFATDSVHVAANLEEAGVMAFSNTVTPDDWKHCTQELCPYPNIIVGFGWHPWWATANLTPHTKNDYDPFPGSTLKTRSDTAQWTEALQIADALQELLNQVRPRALGEIGLDFSSQNHVTKDRQLAIFEAFAKWAGMSTGCLLSLHAVEATSQTLEILEGSHVLNNCPCIYHWFSGSSADLNRALKDGCYFSVNTRMLKSKKGREYVRQIPVERLLLESDLPSKPHMNLEANDLIENLSLAVQEINQIKGTDCTAHIDKTAKELLQAVRD